MKWSELWNLGVGWVKWASEDQISKDQTSEGQTSKDQTSEGQTS